jgi:hypothetical protein
VSEGLGNDLSQSQGTQEVAQTDSFPCLFGNEACGNDLSQSQGMKEVALTC